MKMIQLCTGLFLATLLLTHCAEPATTTNDDQPAQPTQEDLVKKGEYLVQIMGCGDCHTPKMMTPNGPAPNPERLLSGHPSDEVLPEIADAGILNNYALFNMSLTAGIGPWGTTYSANLTPHDTGLGNWTLEQFGKALREGKSKGMDGTRPILPPMPWQNYVNLSDDDLQAMFAYLQSIPPVDNVVPAPQPPKGDM